MRDWLERPGEPASDLDLVVLLLNSLDLLEDPPDRLAGLTWFSEVLGDVGRGDISRLGSHELFQWAGQDIFVSASVRKRFAAAAPQSPVGFFPRSDHQLTTAAQIARDKFLATELGLSG